MSNRAWMIAGLLVGVLAIWLAAHAVGSPYLTNDSYQYIDVARSWTAGECLCTHIAHFDEQVSTGRMPVPFTHFPPGYPILIGTISRLGVSFETAGVLLSAASFLVTLWLIWDIALTLGAQPWIAGLLSLLWIVNSHALLDATKVGTDAPFTAVLMAIAAFLARDLRNDGKDPALLLLLGAAAGAGYWLRYADLFLLPVAALYILWRCWQKRETLWWALGGLFLEGAITAAVLIRNTIHTGSWRGGFTSSSHRPLLFVLKETFKSYYHFVFGDRAIARADAPAIAFGLAAAAIIFLMIQAWQRNGYAALPKFAKPALVWIGVLVAAYLAGIVLTALITIALNLTRYNGPVYPLLLAAAAPILSVALKGRRVATLVLLVGSILAIHSRSLLLTPPAEPHVLAKQMLNTEVQPGMTAGAFLLAHVSPGESIIAVNGQALEYLLHRNVIATIEPQNSQHSLNEDFYRTTMTRFHARYLLVFPGLSPDFVPEQKSIPFLRSLVHDGAAAPDWLRLSIRNQAVAIYECAACTG